MNHSIITTSSMINNRNNQSIKGCHPSVETHNHHIVRTLQVLLTAITMLFSLGIQGAWCADAKLCARFVDTNKSVWDYRGLTVTSDKVVDKDFDQEIYFVTNSGKNTLKSVKYLSSQAGAIVYIPVPSGSAGTVTMTANSSSDSRYYQLMVGENGNQNQRLYSKYDASISDDGKKGPQSFTFASSDITILNDKTYLKLVATGGEMKVNTFTVELTEGTYATISSVPVFTTDLPSSLTISAGSPYTFAPVVEQGFSYQWYKDDVKIDGAIYPTYTYTPENVGTASFKLVVENSQGSTTSTVCAVTATLSDARRLITASFSNGFDAFITEPTNEANGKVQVYYIGGTSEPTLTNTIVSSKATASAIIDGKITVTAENGQTAIYDVAIDAVTPLTVTPGTNISETTFTAIPDWIKAPYGYDGTKGIKFGKNEDPRISNGQNRICLFVAKSKSVTLTNTGVTSDRNIKVYVNGTETSGITSIGKNSGSSNSITITTSQVDGPVLISIVSNQTGGDGGFTKYSVVAPDAVSPDLDPTPEVIPFSIADEATTAADHYPTTEWGAGHEVQLPQGLPEFTEANTIYINAAAYGASTSSNDNTTAIQAALNAVPAGGGMVVVPAGTWLSGPLTVKSKTVLHLKDGAVLKLLPFAGVNVVPTAGSGKYPVNNSETQNIFTYKMFLTCADNATDIVVEGEGDGSIIEGQGGDWWPNRDNMGTRPPLIRFQKGSRFLFRNFKLQNAPGTNLALSNSNGASDFTVHNVTIKNPSSIDREATADGYTAVSHNTDGIPVWGARVNIYDCLIDTGDDNIVFDSDSQYGHVWHCTFKRGHGASFGSYTERLHHIIYEDITFDGTSAGFRIKTQRGRSGNETCNTDKDGNVVRLNGSVHDIICRNAEMTNVTEPIVLTTHYDKEVDDPENFESAAVTYQTPEYKDFLFKDITVKSIGNCYSGFNRQRPIYIYGLPELYIHDITFDNVKITGANTAYLAYCRDIHFTNGTTITNTANPTSVVGTKYEASWTGSLLPSDLAISDGKGTVAMTVGDTDKALVKGTDYTTSSEGVITLSSNNEEVVTIVDGKIHAVGAGTAKVTISQAELAANGIYGAGAQEVTVNIAAAPVETTIYSWQSPEGTVQETGGTIAYVNGAEGKDYRNYTQTPYYTILLNGKKGNLNDQTGSDNAGHMVITLTEGLKTGDKITMTGFRNKAEAGKKASVYMVLENNTIFAGTEGGEGLYWTNIASNDEVADFDNDGDTPNSYTWEVPAAEEGSKTITLTRNDGGTNLFITKIEIKGNRAALTASDLAIADGKGTVAMTVGDTDKALAKDVDYTTSSTGAVTLSSSDEAVATIVDGKIHAVAAGTATITISQEADANYEAGEAQVSVTVTAAAEPSEVTLYSWESSGPESTDITETGGTIKFIYGDNTNRLNYANDVKLDAENNKRYYTICLTGKKANVGDAEKSSANAARMEITFDKPLKAGDKVAVTAYKNKGDSSKKASIYFLYSANNTEVNGEDSFNDVLSGSNPSGLEPNTIEYVVPDAADGSNKLTLTRNDGATNLFITKLVITGEARGDDPEPTPEYPKTATWDFDALVPSTLNTVSVNNTTGTVSSDVDGVELKVQASSGTVDYHNNGTGYVQMTQGTKILVPVNTNTDKVVILSYPSNHTQYTVAGATPDKDEFEHIATDGEVAAGYVEIVANSTAYICSIKVTHNGPAPEKPQERTFKDFEIDLTKDPVGALPEGVTQMGYSNHGASFNGSHGWMWYAVKFDVDGPVKITLGGCQYTEGTGDSYEAYVTDKTGTKVLDIPTKTTTCKNVTGIYNVEGDNTLTVYCGQYCTGIKVEACDYIPQVNVKYYDADGQTILATDVVNGGSALAYNATATSSVTVASGKKFRGWKNSEGVVVAEGTTLNADLSLYACVTDIEVATKNSEHTYNLTDSKFLVDEHELISVTNGSFHDGQHGWAFSNGGKVTLSLAGNATITVGNCIYPQNGTTKIVAKNASDETFGECDAVVASDGATYTFIYEGGAGDVTLNITGGQAYIHSIKITHTGDLTLPVWSDEKNAYTFKTKSDAATNAKELLYVMSYVNGQTEHDKTIFIPNGTYDLGTAHNTSIPAGMHLIGESQNGVLIKNQPTEESINATATFQIDGAGVTLENMTIKCRAPYTTGDGHNAERGVCIQDCGNGSYYKNVTLDGLQDTYYSNGAAGMTATFDNCIVRGNVDFFCGNGDITVNNSHLQIVTTHGSGGTAVICAPATYTNGETQGYLFDNCVVEAATSAVDCLVSGHSTNQKFALARAWYNGTDGTDKTPRVTFKDTEFEIKPNENWTTMGSAQPGGAPVFQIINTGVQFSDEAMVIDKTNKPFAYATATDRTASASVNASNITGGGEYDLETIMEKMEAGDGYTAGTTKEISTSNGTKKAIVLKSANTTENGKEKRNAMDQTIIDAINKNDIIVLDGAGYSDFVVKSVMTFRKVANKTVVGINGARLCTEWYLTDYFKSILENVPTSSGTGVNSASTAEGTGGDLYDKDGKFIEHIKEEGEFLTRKNLYAAVGNEDYRYSGIFYLGACKNWIIRNLKLVGPGSLDCAGYDLMAIIDSDNGTKFSDHMWVDHCEFIDGMDGNFDITNGSDFVTVSWCKFYYTDRSYAHQNTNLVGSSDDKKAMDGGKLNITFAYNEWGANCRARMPMARFGRIHMLNNYYNCAGNSEYAMNPRIESEFLVEGNYWERGVRRAYNPNGQKAVTWGNNNYYADKAADKAGSNTGDFTVTVPYQYSALMLDPHKVPEVITLNGGAKLYQKPYFTTNLGVADNTPGTPELQHNAELSEELKQDGLVFSVWAENAHTFQWYKQDIALDGTEGEWAMLEGENRNTYTYKPETGVEFNLKCQAFGVSGEKTSDILKVKIDGLAAPYYLGGVPTEMQTVYTGSPMTFTANFKDAQGYQWYKNTTNEIVVDDAHKIDGATSNTYTYEPSSAEIFYLYCVASNSNGKGDGYSDVVKVKGVKRDLKFHLYSVYDTAASQTSVFVIGTSSHNINNVGTKDAAITIDHTGCTTSDKVGECSANANSTKDSDNNSIPGFRFNNCNNAEHKNVKADVYLHFTLSNAIAEGDKILMSMITGGSGNPQSQYGFHICSASSLGENNANVLKTVGIPSNSTQTKYVYNPEAFDVPEALVGKTEFYVIPFVKDPGKNVQLNDMQIFSGETKPVDDPVITKDLNETYETGKNTTLALTIEATDAASYQWYSNTVQSTEGATLIEGATSATYNYPTDKVSTKYVYCVVTGSKLGSAPVNSTIAKVSVVDGATATITYATANIKADGTGVSDPDGIMSEISVKLEGDKYSWDTSFSNNKNDDNTTYACIKASAAVPENIDFVTFTITPKNGKMLIADELSFGVCRVGTDNGDLKVYANGTLLTEASGKTVVKPGRNSDGKKQDGYVFSYSLKDYSITETEPLTIKLNLYGSISGKTWGIADLKVTGIVKDYVITNVSNPKSEKGTWDEENEKWNYTLSCTSMDFAKLNYQIGEESVQSNQTNPVSIKVAPGETFKFWGSDPREGDEHLENSEEIIEKADAMPATATPNVTLSNYNVATHKYTLTISGQDAEATVYYTTDGSDPATSDTKQTYSAELALDPATTVKAIAVRNHYASSPVLETLAPAVNVGVAETFKTTGAGSADAEASGKNNVIVSGTIDGANISGIDGATGLKYTTSREVTVTGDTKVKGIQIDVHEGFVVTEVQVNNAYSNDKSKSTKITAVYVDGVKLNDFEAKELPASGSGSIKFAIEGITAKNSIILETSYDTDKVNQARAAISLVYEFVDAPVGVTITDSKNSEDIITLAGDDLTAFKNNHTYTVDVNKVYAEDPIVKIITEKGYEYIVPAGEIETEGDKLTHFTKSFVGVEYTVKAKVNAVKSPNIEIANDMSLKGGYKVTLKYSEESGTVPYIKVDDREWEQYDPNTEYFALKNVQSKMKYGSEQSLETVVRDASCPDNSYEAGKPFAVYLYVNGYSDNQVGTHAYNNESFKTDKIYQAVANQFNVIPLAVDNSKEILSYRSDITDAKLVVITETLGGSGSVEIADVGNKSNMMALTLKRDVLDRTNVLNLKMFLNGSSSANNQRWQWAQPRAMVSELTSIMPCTPDGGGMYEIFGNATMSRDASINLWDDINTENMLYHLQPVFNFNDENASRPNFTPLALVIDPEEPEDQREEYHAIHFYENNGFQYIGFGLSINEWTQYNENVYAIIDKIGEMIIAGKDLDSKLTGIVKPTVTDNGDGSANVFNNNPNADTYYKVYTQSEYETLNGTVPAAADLISGGIKANDNDFHTEKYTEKMHIFAVSKLGADAVSEVVSGTVEGNSIRYVIRENDDPAAQGMVAKYPFDLNVNSGTFNMPYNQSWKKDGYTVKAWQVTKSSDPALVGTTIVPGTSVSGLTQDITVKAIWSENTFNITDLSKTEDKAARTVTWEFLQSKGAPALSMESKAGNMQAILVGQAKFRRDKEHPTTVTDWIDVPMTINTDNLATLPDNGTEYHGKFNNTSTNWAKQLKDTDGETVLYTGSDYAQVRTGTQFTFPAVYGSNVVYKAVELVEAVNGEANGNVNRSQISQSYITDGSKTADALNYWRLSNPGFELDPGWTGPEDNKVLQPNSKVVFSGDAAQLATTSPTYEKFKTSMGAMGYDNILYDEDNKHNPIGGNFNYGGLIYYNGEATEATLTSVESAQYVHVGADTGKKLGALNYGSVFMQSLSVTYPALYDLTCTWIPAKSELDPEEDPEKKENPGKIEKLNDPRPNCGGRYVLYDDINLKLTPAYGYYVDVDNDEVKSGDVVTKEAYYFLMDGNHSGQALKLVGATSHIYRYKDAGYAGYSDEIKANIPEDGAYITMKVQDIDLVVSMKKWPTVKYKVEAYPSTQGYITFNSGNGRPHEDEYEEFPVGKKFYITAHPNTGYKFKEWRRNTGTGEILVSKEVYDALDNKTGYWALPNKSVTFGDGIMVNPFDKNDYLETNELLFTAGTDNHGNNADFTYVAVFEKAKTGTGYYEFEYALEQERIGQPHSEMKPIEVTDEDKNQFPSEFTSELLNFPKYFTLFKPGYTLDHWVEISGTDTGEGEEHVFTPTKVDGTYQFGKAYNPGSYYNFETEGEIKHLVPVFKKNPTSYDYRATPVDIKWDLRVAQRAQRVNFKSGTSGNTAADTKIYYSTQAIINGDVHIDVPLTITLGKKGKLVNDIEEEDKWCAMGEGTTIVIPSGLGAKFTIASLSKMETTTIDGVVPTSYTVEKIDDADVYLYTFTTTSESTSVTLKIGDDYTYYKYIRAELPAADAVPLTVTVNNDAFGTVDIAAARTTADTEDNAPLLAKINATKEPLPTRALNSGHSYTLGLGTIVSLHAKRSHLYVLDYFEDGDGHRYYYNKDDETKHLTVKDMDGNDITTAATAVDEYLKMEKVQDIMKSQNDIQLTFQVQSYSESMHAVYKENTLYQVNYTSGEEAEGEAPGMTLVEDGESFMIPAENHHLYLDGQTLRYWVDEDGNKYDLGQSYTLGQTFTASKDLPSGITSGKGFSVPKKDIFLTPVFKVNDFTVMNLSTTATATWPLSRKGGATYEGNGDIVINFEGINGIYVTPLKLENGDFIDLKMDIRGENGKANNVNSSDRCQVNSGTVFGLPSSSNCTFTLNSANSSISAKIDGATVEGQQTVSKDYTGDKTQIDVQFTGNTYLYEVVAEYKHVTTELPELDYATVGNISLGALGTPLAKFKLSTLKKEGEVSGVPADLSNSTTGIMPVVRGTATRGGYVEVIQATIDNPTATMLVKTRDGVTVSVYKIGFTVTYPDIAPRVTDLKVDRKFQCDLQKMYEKAIEDTRVDGTNYINDNAYLRHLGVDGDNAANERVAINGVINIKFSTKMAETTLPAATFKANGTGVALGQAIYALEGQTLTFTYKGLDVNTEYDFIIPAGTFKDVFYAESTEQNKANHVYNQPIRIHFTTVETAISTDRRVINYVVTHNQASHFDADQAKMVADGEPVQVASNELIENLKAADIPYGTLDDGVKLANAYKESGKRFYIFVPDGEYQLMGNDFVKSVSSPIGEDGKTMTLGKMENVYSGITTVSRDNVSITGQSQEKTIVYNHPVFEGLSNASTLKLNGGIANFYAQDLTLQNRFDFLRCRRGGGTKGVAPALWDRSAKPIFKNVKFDSYQDTYYTNANNQFDDTRGYAENCTIMGYVDFICGDGDDWFQNCNMVVRQGVGSTATNMFAPRQYDTQKWGYVMNKCTFSAENNTAFDVNNGKMTIARPWANSPAETLIECKYDVLSTDDGYKKMTGGGLILRMQEYKSYNSDGTILDLSKRSLRNSTPGIGSYDAVMTPSKAAEYNLFDVMGGEDGYDPTLYTAQVNMTSGIKQDDTFLTWDDQKEALCYFIFTSDTENGEYKLFAVTDGTEFEMGNAQINKWFCVRAANQRGGLGEPTAAFQYKAHESYKRALVNNNQVIDGWRWSTIYLDFDAKAPIVQHEEMVDGEMKTVDDIYVYALVKVDATKLTFKRVKTMEKDCGYLIKARPRPEEYEFKYTEKTPVYYNDMTVPEYVEYRNSHKENTNEPDIQMPHMSLMNGSVVDKPAAGTAGYTLASKTSYGLGFYKYVGSTYNANYAWLDAALVAEAQKAMADGSLSSEAKAGFMLMVFDDDIIEEESGVATDLDGISNRHLDDDDAIYNLAGQRINPAQMQRGMIYIIGGKKIRY